MKKFDHDAALGQAVPTPTRGDALRSLVKFAIGQGYYDLWNKAHDVGVNPCASGGFYTHKDRVSR